MMCHSKIRAEQRYGIGDFNPLKALKEIRADRCIQTDESLEKFSRTFYLRYENRYLRVVTDYNAEYVKTVLPDNYDFTLLEKLIEKISSYKKIA